MEKKKTEHVSAKKTKASKVKKPVNTKRIISIVVVVFFVSYFVYTMIWQQILLSGKLKEIDALNEKIAAYEQQKSKLEQELENINDPEYLEKVAREKLGLVRPNERVFIDANQSDSNQDN